MLFIYYSKPLSLGISKEKKSEQIAQSFGFEKRGKCTIFIVFIDLRGRNVTNLARIKNKLMMGEGKGSPNSSFMLLLFNNTQGHRTPASLKHTHIMIIREGDNLNMEIRGEHRD